MTLSIFSDLHITHEQDDLYLKLLAYLSAAISADDHVVFAGDIFDLFVGTKAVFRNRYSAFFTALNRIDSIGAHIYFIEGNHDFHIAGLFSTLKHARFSSDQIDLELAGKKFHFEHGDLADSDDHSYRRLRVALRSFPVRKAIDLVPGSWVDWIGRNWSRYSRDQKPLLPQDLKSEELERLRGVYRAYANRLYKNGYDFIVMGHCHDLDEMSWSENGRSGQYINMGFPAVHRSFLFWEPSLNKIMRKKI